MASSTTKTKQQQQNKDKNELLDDEYNSELYSFLSNPSSSSSSSSLNNNLYNEGGVTELILSLTPDQIISVAFTQKGKPIQHLLNDNLRKCYSFQPPFLEDSDSMPNFHLNVLNTSTDILSPFSSSSSSSTTYSYSPIEDGYTIYSINNGKIFSTLEKSLIWDVHSISSPFDSSLICSGVITKQNSEIVEFYNNESKKLYKFSWPPKEYYIVTQEEVFRTSKPQLDASILLCPDTPGMEQILDYPIEFQYTIENGINTFMSYQFEIVQAHQSKEYVVEQSLSMVIFKIHLQIVNKTEIEFKNVQTLTFLDQSRYSTSESHLIPLSSRSIPYSSSSPSVAMASSSSSTSSSSSNYEESSTSYNPKRSTSTTKQQQYNDESDHSSSGSSVADDQLDAVLNNMGHMPSFDFYEPTMKPFKLDLTGKNLVIPKKKITQIVLSPIVLRENYLVYHFSLLSYNIGEKIGAIPTLWMKNAQTKSVVPINNKQVHVNLTNDNPRSYTFLWQNSSDLDPRYAEYVSRPFAQTSNNIFIETVSQLYTDAKYKYIQYNAYNFNLTPVIIGISTNKLSTNPSSILAIAQVHPYELTQVPDNTSSSSSSSKPTKTSPKKSPSLFQINVLPQDVKQIKSYPWLKSIPPNQSWSYFYLPAATIIPSSSSSTSSLSTHHNISNIIPGFSHFIGQFLNNNIFSH